MCSSVLLPNLSALWTSRIFIGHPNTCELRVMSAETGACQVLPAFCVSVQPPPAGFLARTCTDLICSDPPNDACAAGSLIVAFRPSQCWRFVQGLRAVISGCSGGCDVKAR